MRPPERFRLIAVVLFVCTLALATALALSGPRPDITAVVILGGLLALAEHRAVVLPNGSGLSASFMLAMSSVVAFEGDARFLGPLLVGMFGGLYVPHFVTRSWSKILGNAGVLGLSCAAAAAVAAMVPAEFTRSILGQIVVALPVGLTFSLVNYLLLVPLVAAINRVSVTSVASELWLSDWQVYPFALMGVALGRTFLSLGAWVVPLFFAPIFIARQAFASYLELRAAQEATLQTLIRALESKDRYTAGHVERVARFAEYIGRELGFRSLRLERLRHAALMHDIGKLVIPNQILNKPGRLTADEYQRMRHHELVSVELLQRIDFLAPVAPNLDVDGGTGNPGETASLEAKIIAVADAFDAMTSTRAYRRALTQEVAFGELREKAGTQFDAACAHALIAAVESRGERYGAGHEEAVADFAAPPPTVGTGSAGLGDLEGDTGRVTA